MNNLLKPLLAVRIETVLHFAPEALSATGKMSPISY